MCPRARAGARACPERYTAAVDPTLRERVSRHLAAFDRVEVEPAGHKQAAVALALVDDADGRDCVVLTRRPLDMSRHPGQFALPGGRIDPGESVEQAARRELAEEVGLELGPDAILGLLDDFVTRSGWVITPVVLWGGAGVALVPDPREVAEVYRVPLASFLEDDAVGLDRIAESDRPVLWLHIVGTRVFAPTAAILLQLREVALHGRATRVAHYEQPLFAWR
jgi:8-oxo-dGTP pyrophosphatase MutT (NUDIX family)